MPSAGYDAVIVGAGACGLMCAVQAGFRGKKVLLLEKNEVPGAKILISGGGRCNYTNLYTTAENFQSENEHFCKSALSQWTVEDTLSFFETYGIEGKEKTLGQLFPVSDKAKDIVALFSSLCTELGQQILTGTETLSITGQAGDFTITYQQQNQVKTVKTPKVILASGGLPIKKMGASDFALAVARQYGLSIAPVAPALVPLTITGKDAGWYSDLSGNTVFSRVWNDRASFEENILFTHWGLSGPAILQISSYWRPGEKIFIDLLPGNNITSLIIDERKANGKKSLGGFLCSFYSRKFVEGLGKYIPAARELASLTNAEMEKIQQLIHEFTVIPAGDKGYDKAEVMRGGISTMELSSKTLEAKKVPGLYFGGECVDVTGWLGGYNFQWAWASGFAIAANI